MHASDFVIVKARESVLQLCVSQGGGLSQGSDAIAFQKLQEVLVLEVREVWVRQHRM